MSIRLIALDIDGTLTNDLKEITPVTSQCLLGLEKRSVRLVLASARPVAGLFEMRDKLEMRKYGGILMAYNGGMITDAGGNVLRGTGIGIDRTVSILRYLETLPVTVILDDGNVFYVTNRDGYKVAYECRNNRMPCKEVKSLPEAAVFSPAKILLAAVPEKIYDVQREIAGFLPDDMTVVRTAPFYLEIIPRSVDKGKALSDICEMTGTDIKDSAAFGDSENDITMLKAAGTGIAMGNAEEAVKAAADMVTLSNNEDGIAYALRELMRVVD